MKQQIIYLQFFFFFFFKEMTFDNLKSWLVFSAMIKRKGVVNNDAQADTSHNRLGENLDEIIWKV